MRSMVPILTGRVGGRRVVAAVLLAALAAGGGAGGAGGADGAARAESARADTARARADTARARADSARARADTAHARADTAAFVPAPAPVPFPRPFGVGESLTFSVQYGPIKAGTAVLAVEGIEQVSGRPCYRFASTTRSNAVFSAFYKVRDRVTSLADVTHLLTRRTRKDLHEKDYRLEQEIVWDQEQGQLTYEDGTMHDLVFGARDILAALYFVRTLPLASGAAIPMPAHDNKKSYSLVIHVLGEETIDTPLGRFDCWIVEPKLESEGLFRRTGSLKVWVTRDENRFPVMMQSAVKVGAISAILIELERGDRSPPPLGLNAN